MSTAIKHPVPDRVKPSFVIFDIRALWLSGLSSRVLVIYKCYIYTGTVAHKGPWCAKQFLRMGHLRPRNNISSPELLSEAKYLRHGKIFLAWSQYLWLRDTDSGQEIFLQAWDIFFGPICGPDICGPQIVIFCASWALASHCTHVNAEHYNELLLHCDWSVWYWHGAVCYEMMHVDSESGGETEGIGGEVATTGDRGTY